MVVWIMCGLVYSSKFLSKVVTVRLMSFLCVPPSFAAQQEGGEVEEVYDGLLGILVASVCDNFIDLVEYGA